MRLLKYLNEKSDLIIYFPKVRKMDKKFAGLIAHIFHGQVTDFGYDKRQRQNYVTIKGARQVYSEDDVIERLHAQDIEATWAQISDIPKGMWKNRRTGDRLYGTGDYYPEGREIKEGIDIDIEIGDVILGGRFKNKRVTVKKIEQNEKGDWLVNGKPLLKYRIPPPPPEEEIEEEKINEGSHTLGTIIKTSSEKVFLKKYQQMVDSDRAYYGHDPYSGSWATIPAVKIVPMPYELQGKKITRKIENKIWDYIYDTAEKWEPAIAIKTKKGYFVGGWAIS